jgi:hypothetical protein
MTNKQKAIMAIATASIAVTLFSGHIIVLALPAALGIGKLMSKRSQKKS